MKREVSDFVPYKFQDGAWRVFLQKRTEDAPTSPGLFGLFGGGIDAGETPEQAFLRETKEELNYHPITHRCFGRYELEEKIGWAFGEEVDSTFESKITVLEGQYGQWFTEEEITREENVIDFIRVVLRDVYRQLKEHSSVASQ